MKYSTDIRFTVLGELDEKLPFYVTTSGVDYLQERMERPEGYPDYQWIQTMTGKGVLIHEGRSLLLEPGMGMLLYPNDPHLYYSESDLWIVNFVSFHGSAVSQLLLDGKLAKTSVHSVLNPSLLSNDMYSIYNILGSQNIMNGYESSKHLYSLLLNLINLASSDKEQSQVTSYQKLENALKYIEANYDKAITLQELSSICNITREYFCRLFKQSLGIRPTQYVNKIRVTKAKEFLSSQHKLTINEIAKLVGFEDTNYFCYVFKAYTGITPTNFRSLHLWENS